MKGLAKLRVVVRVHGWRYPDWKFDENELLRHVKAVTKPRDFELTLPWREMPGLVLDDIPCNIVRVEGHALVV